jgi:hypothetical protein
MAATSQTATANFTFSDSKTLVILLTESTPSAAASVTGSSAVLTSLGFHLPAGQLQGGFVVVAPGSSSVGFEHVNPQLGSGSDVSSEWGYTRGSLPSALRAQALSLKELENDFALQAQNLDTQAAAELARAQSGHEAANALLASNPTDPATQQEAAELHHAAEQDERDAFAFQQQAMAARNRATELNAQAIQKLLQTENAPDYHFVGVHELIPTPLATIPPATNLVGPIGLGGADGGLLNDATAADGVGVVSPSVLITLLLSQPLDLLQQDNFLRGVVTDSIVEYGVGIYGTSSADAAAVPAPGSGPVLALALATLYRPLRRRMQALE